LPLQHSVRPTDAYVDLLADIRAVGPTPQRLAAIYDVLLPALGERYRRYLSTTDGLVDAPTVRILERELAEMARMIEACRGLRQELPALQLHDDWREALQGREATIEPVVAYADGAVALEA
jgi:hypothetical protein